MSYAVEAEHKDEQRRLARIRRRLAALERERAAHEHAFSRPLIRGVRGYTKATMDDLRNRIKGAMAWGTKGASL